jgi:hypothetical protein
VRKREGKYLISYWMTLRKSEDPGKWKRKNWIALCITCIGRVSGPVVRHST